MAIFLKFWEFSPVVSDLDCHRSKKVCVQRRKYERSFCFRELEEWSCFSKKAVFFRSAVFSNLNCLMVALDLRAVFGGNVSS